MDQNRRFVSIALVMGLLGLPGFTEVTAQEQSACEALMETRNLTFTMARLITSDSGPPYCYVKGIIPPNISYHVQLPLPRNWNGRFLSWGDGGKDGDLDFADHRVAQGYAVANSNMGHDSGSEPMASFGFNNRQSEIDFSYRAVHLTVNAAKTVIKAYYEREPEYSYHEGCSTGGREGLMEAQSFPYEFDGIVAGAPVNFYQEANTGILWQLHKIILNNFGGNLAFDTNGDGTFDSLRKLEILAETVQERCDSNDGIQDGVINNPLACDFDPDRDLTQLMCQGDINADDCFTKAQLQTIKDLYSGPYDSKGVSIYKGLSPGSELQWARGIIAWADNSNAPAFLNNTGTHFNYLFYEKDPGVHPPQMHDVTYVLDKTAPIPEWAWWEFDFDDYTAGKGDFMKSLTNSDDPDMTRFLIKNGGKLILYHGWADAMVHPEPVYDYYKDVIATTFRGNLKAAKDSVRLFMVPGMGHCQGGPGPNSWDKLSALVDWVEKGKAPDYLVATHSSDEVVDNERKLCAYPEIAAYTGPAGGENDPANWVESNFECRTPL